MSEYMQLDAGINNHGILSARYANIPCFRIFPWMNAMDYLLLIVLWCLWCVLHSGMIALRSTDFLKTRLGNGYRYYRLVFNGVSIVTLVPLLIYGSRIDAPVLYEWCAPLLWLKWMLLSAAIGLFVLGALKYDMLSFAGIRQLRSGNRHDTSKYACVYQHLPCRLRYGDGRRRDRPMVTAPTRIHLVRHGAVHNPERILYGRLPRFNLNDAGLRQAQAAAHWLNDRPLAALFSSPMLRARQTAQAIVDLNPDLRLQISTWLNEVHTCYEGRPGAELDARGGDVYTGCGKGYERPEDLVARVRKFSIRVRKHSIGSQVAAVTHGDIVTFTVLWALGFDSTPQNKTRLRQAGYPVAYPGHASITILTYHTADPDERPEIDYYQP